MKGETLAHYRVIEQVGHGASGVIYKAEDLALGRPVALKCLPPDLPANSSSVLRFQHEARTASSINHPNICTIYEIAEHQGRQFIVMEWLEGQTLAHLINGRALRLENFLEITIQIAGGLGAAHDAGVVHRDIKPANILVTSKGQAKILDFGISLLLPRVPSDTSSIGAQVGTAPYMSPEQARGDEIDARSDLFSLGTVLYEMATGRRAFVGPTVPEIMQAILDRAPELPQTLNPALPGDLDRIVMKALEKNRKLRFQTAADLRVDLERLQRDFDSGTLHFHPNTPPRVAGAGSGASTARSSGVPAMAVAAMAGLAIAAAVLAVRPSANGGTGVGAPVDVPAGGQIRRDIVLAPAARTSGPVSALPNDRASASVISERAPALAASVDRAGAFDRPIVKEELSIATKKADAGLYDQALDTVRNLLSKYGGAPEVTEAYFLMASIQERQTKPEDAMATYLEIADRYEDSDRASEALYRFADLTLKSRRSNKEIEARKVLEQVADRYPKSSWAPQALMLKAGIEESQRVYQRDEVLATSVPSALVTYRRLVSQYADAAGAEAALQKMAKMYEDARRFDLAATAYAQLATRYPAQEPDAWFHAAEIYRRRLKQPATARSAYARVPPTSQHFKEAQERLK